MKPLALQKKTGDPSVPYDAVHQQKHQGFFPVPWIESYNSMNTPRFIGYEHLDFQTNVVVFFHESLFALGTLKSGDAFNFQRNLSVHCPKWRIQFSRIPLTGPFVGGHVPRFQLQRELHQRLVKSCTQSQLLRFHPQGDLILHVPGKKPPHLTPQNTKS